MVGGDRVDYVSQIPGQCWGVITLTTSPKFPGDPMQSREGGPVSLITREGRAVVLLLRCCDASFKLIPVAVGSVQIFFCFFQNFFVFKIIF